MVKICKKQIYIVLISLTIFVSCITGCTAKFWYEAGKINAEHNCNKAPFGEHEQCLKNINNKTYKEYEKEALRKIGVKN